MQLSYINSDMSRKWLPKLHTLTSKNYNLHRRTYDVFNGTENSSENTSNDKMINK